MGKSGCGKSTLLSILASLDSPSLGQVLLDDKDIATLDNKELSTLRNEAFGFIFQQANLIMNLNVEENILLPFHYSKHVDSAKAKERVAYLLEALNLKGYNQRRVHNLSGGEMQRVAIARALVKEPQIIFADEPTGNLDQGNTQEILSFLQTLIREQNLLAVMVTHDSFSASFCNQRLTLGV